MSDLYFPQLSSGALSQYPIRKSRVKRSVKNLFADGSALFYEDPGVDRQVWQLAYQGLSAADITALRAHFKACSGPFRGFTFIDPVENMLVSSSDLAGAAWQNPGRIQIAPGAGDPEGGTAAFVLTNTTQAPQEISQSLHAPSSFHYCLSVYAIASQRSTMTLFRRGGTAEAEDAIAVGPAWSRIVSSGRLIDADQALTVGLRLQAGQQIEVYGVQLEAQHLPSRYRPTTQKGGVWHDAHWGMEQLAIVAEAPDQFATSFSIETAV